MMQSKRSMGFLTILLILALALAACAPRRQADVGIAYGKAAVWVGMLVIGGGDVG